MDSPLSILGSIASIGAAVWAFIEAKKSATSATHAAAIRDEITNRKRLVVGSHVYAETKRMISVAGEVGPATDPKRLRGVDSARIARELSEYVRLVLDESSHFPADIANEARDFCDRLGPDIQALAEARIPEVQKALGTRIHQNILAFQSHAKKLADDQQVEPLKTQNRGAK